LKEVKNMLLARAHARARARVCVCVCVTARFDQNFIFTSIDNKIFFCYFYAEIIKIKSTKILNPYYILLVIFR